MNNKINKKSIQELVLRKTAGLIAQKGPKGWSTLELAQECGLAKNTLYKIIGNKEQLVEKIVMDQIEATTSMLKTIIRREKGYAEAVKRMVEEGPVFLSERPRVAFPEIFLEFPAIEPKARDCLEKSTAAVMDFIKQGQKDRLIRSDVTPEFLYDLVRGIVEHYTRSGLDERALTDALRKAFLCLSEGVRVGTWQPY